MHLSSPTAAAKPKKEGSFSSCASVLPHRRFDWQKLVLCMGLMAAVIVCYIPVTHNAFVSYDDDVYITENTHLTAGMNWVTVKWAFTSFDAANWHPLTWLSHALDYQVFGLNPAGPHWENVLLHAVNAVLLFLLLESATGFRWRSLMVAALFALHPINVESVAWAAERKNVLSMMFFLLTLYAYAWYTRRPGRLRIAFVACLFAIALLAKPQVITLPFLLLLLDYWPLQRVELRFTRDESGKLHFEARGKDFPAGKLVWEKAPLFVLSAISAVLTMLAQTAGGAVKDLSRFSFLVRVEVAIIGYVRYLGKAFWPSRLVAMYPHPTRLYPAWEVGAAAVVLLLITALVLYKRDQRYLAVGWFWFLGSLVPMVGLVQVGVQSIADRYAYISFIGLFVMVVWLAADAFETRKISRRWLVIPALACLVACAILTWRQVRYWHDSETFWRRTLALTEDNYIAHRAMAVLFHNQGNNEAAMKEIRIGLAIWPQDPVSNIILGRVEAARRDFATAIQCFQLAANYSHNPPFQAQAFSYLGYAYRATGETEKAKQAFEASLHLLPPQPAIMVQLGVIDQLEGDPKTAVNLFAGAMRMQPTDVGFLLLANALIEEGGHQKEADLMVERAERMSKDIDAAEKQAKSLLGEQ
jgi:tetratricopeptide (TPR) repeat protein